jgi:hypothetical protein
MTQKILSARLIKKNQFDQVIIPTSRDIEEIKIKDLLLKLATVLASYYKL